MGRKFSKYIVSMISVIMLITVLGGHIAEADSIDDDYSIKGMYDKVTGKKDLEKTLEKSKEEVDPAYKEKKKKEETKKSKNSSYAKILFKDAKKNQKLMYYKAQTGTKAPTVESKIAEDTHNAAEGENYASFLYSLSHWNLYNVASTQQDSIFDFLTSCIKAVYGSILIGCLYLLTGLEALKTMFANIIDYMNIWKYITVGGELPEDNPLHILNPVIEVYNKLTVFFKIILAIFMGWIAVRLVTGVGKARNRATYFKNKGMKVVYAILAMTLAASFASLALSIASDMLKSSEGASTSVADKIPKSMIVDTHQYIDNSLKKTKGKKGAEGTNDGYVLNHDKGFPTSYDQVQNNLPTKELIEYMNTDGNQEISDKLDGLTLLKRWTFSNTMNANDISTMYDLNTDPKPDNNFKFLHFKLDPQEDGVKLTGGKEFFGTELKDAQISSASLAGNTGFGVFLNAIKMGAIIITITVVVVTLYLAIFTGVVNAFKDFFVNVSFSQVGAYQAFFGVAITAIMLLLGIGVSIFLVQLFPNIVLYLDDAFTQELNNYDFSGHLKQMLQTLITLFVLWWATKLVYMSRKGIMTFVSEWFSRILETMNPEGAIGSSRMDKQALDNAVASNLYGQEAAENFAENPYGATQDFAEKGVQSVRDLQDKGRDKLQSVRDSMNGVDEENQDERKSMQFNGHAKGTTDDNNDIEGQTDELKQDIDEGIGNLESTSQHDVANNLGDQEKSIANATTEFEKLKGAQKELQDAESSLEALKQADAPQEEILAAEQRVADAERAYNSQLGRSQEASRALSRSGASIADIGRSKAQSMHDYHEASHDIESSEQELADLMEEREDMEAFGASQSQLTEMDKRINQAKDKLSMNKYRQNLAQKAYEANVSNPVVEQAARNELLEAQEEHVSARRNYQQALDNGNLSTEESATLQKAASSLSEEVSSTQSHIDSQIESGEARQNAINFMKGNNGAAFTNYDYQAQQQELQRAEETVKQLQTQYDEVLSSPSPNHDQLTDISQAITSAKTNYDNMQIANQAMQSGSNISHAIKSQEQIISQAYNDKVNAEQKMKTLQEQASAGSVTDRTEINEVEAELKQTASTYNNASRVLAGLQAVQSVGRINIPKADLNIMDTNNSNNLDELYNKQKEVADVQTTVGKLSNGGTASIGETYALSQFQKEARRKASEKVKESIDRYNDIQKKIAKLQQASQSGVAVNHQMSRYKASLRETKTQLDRARNKEAFITSQGFNINSIGNTMKDNIKASKEKMEEVQKIVNDRKLNHDTILKTGGQTYNQLENYKRQIEKDKETAENNVQQLIRERTQKASAAKGSMKE